MTEKNNRAYVEQWDIFALELHGSTEANPYLDVILTAQFIYQHRVIDVDGFYDGDGLYRVRFMPDVQGTWRYRTRSNLDALNGVEGTFTVSLPTQANMGRCGAATTITSANGEGH